MRSLIPSFYALSFIPVLAVAENSDFVRMVRLDSRVYDPMTLNELSRPGSGPTLYFQK